MQSIIKVLFILTLIEQLPALNTDKDVEGKDCIIIEPIRNHTFNLTELRTDLGYYIPPNQSLGDHPESFNFNVCGSMSRKCNNQTAAACMKNSLGKEVVLGYQDKLLWNEGSIRFSYTGEKCDANKNYTLNVMLHCDYGDTKNDFIGVFYDTGHCDVTIFLRTQAACLPTSDNLKNVNCVVKGSEGVFDFNSLRNSNHNAAGPNGTTFIIGICNPVLYGHEAACEAGSSVCLYAPKANSMETQYKNMGTMTQAFKEEKDFISLTMTTKEPCEGNKTYSSKIYFECDPLAHFSYPNFHSIVNCENIFSWPTALACAEKKPCQVADPDTGVSYDFSSLSGAQYGAVNKNNTEETVFFSVCSQANEPCMKSSGSCVVKNSNKQSTQAGVVNDVLKLNGKNAYLLYENGAICKQLGNKFTTRIDFVCADDVKDEGPVAIEDGCAITIYFKTLLACKYIKNCVAKTVNDEEIDLRPLIDFDGNYEATVNEKNLPKETGSVKYLLNVCRPLNAKYSLNCHGSSGACRTEIEKDGKHEKEMSLGHPDYSLSTVKKDDTYEVTMKYFDGAQCPTDKEETIMTEIRFYCNETVGLGNPILQSIDQCKYSFDFPTNILCNERLVDMQNGSCQLINEKASVSVDLSLFGENGVYKVDGRDVSICGGEATKYYTIVYKQSMVRIEFQLPNGKDKIDVEVQLKCSTSNETNTKVDERILVMHASPLICQLLKVKPRTSTADSTTSITPSATNGDDTAKEENTSKGFALGYVFLVSIVVIAFVAFCLVVRNPERREILRNIIKFRSRSSTVQYSRVRLNEESLLLDNNLAGLSDSDDDNILL